MKSPLPKTFFIILISGIVLLTLIVAGNTGMPEPLPTARLVLGIIFVFLVPGYALQMALFPRRADADPLTRAAFSFGLSIAILPPIFLVLTAMGLGVQFWPIAFALTLFILICALVALVRHGRLPEEEKPEFTASLNVKGWWASQDRVSRWLYGIISLALFTAAISGILVSQEKPGEHYTDFYILDSQGLSMDYPREVTAAQQIVFNLGITNHEGKLSQYKVVVVRGEEQALATVGPFSLADGETWKGSVTFEMGQAGVGKQVSFLLERVGFPWPYRTLQVWLNVDASIGNTYWRPILLPAIVAGRQSENERIREDSRL